MIILLLRRHQRATTTTIMIIIIIIDRPPKNQESSSLSSSIIVIMKTAVPMLSIDQPQCFQQISAMYYKRYMLPMAMRPIASDPCRKSSSTNHAKALRWFITIPYQQLPEERRSMHKAQIYSATHSTKWTAEKGQYSPRQLLTTTTRKKYYYIILQQQQ